MLAKNARGIRYDEQDISKIDSEANKYKTLYYETATKLKERQMQLFAAEIKGSIQDAMLVADQTFGRL